MFNLFKKAGIVINVDDATISNNGKQITIKVPLKSFKEYGCDLQVDNDANYLDGDGKKINVIPKSVKMLKDGGFGLVC